jgi:hypothetical protein
MPAHFKTLWKARSINTLSGQLVWEATEYTYSVRMESVKFLAVIIYNQDHDIEWFRSYLQRSSDLVVFNIDFPKMINGH